MPAGAEQTKDYTAKLADFAASLEYDDLPADVVITINTILEGGYDSVIDANEDGVCNILDIVIIIDWIINGLPN